MRALKNRHYKILTINSLTIVTTKPTSILHELEKFLRKQTGNSSDWHFKFEVD
jgi:hypothetical protein